MITRTSLESIVQNALVGTRQLTDQLSRLQIQSTTGKRFTAISDDPSVTMSVLSNQAQAQSFETHVENIRAATGTLNMSVSTLQQVADVFEQARSLALEGSNSFNDASAREAIATQVDALLERLIELTNTENNGRFLFGGTARVEPFVAVRDALGRPTEVGYQGDSDRTTILVDRAREIPLDYPGDEVFRVRQRQATVYLGNTGAAAGTGTDTATARGQLLVRHTLTTFAAGSGVQAGASSPTGDTILGPAGTHRLRIIDTSGTGASGTVSLDGGPAFPFTSADTNLRVTNSTGDVVFLDTTAITPNFNGDIDITSNGTLSTDGGVSSAPIDFTSAQSVVNSATGQVTFVDSTAITRTGNEFLDYPGSYDAFQSLMALRDDLRNTRGLSEREQLETISAGVAELERVHDHVLNTLGEQSSSLQSMQSLQTHLEDLQLTARNTISELEGVDMAELVIQLQSYQNMLQLSLASFSRIIDQSLLDFLR